MRKRLVPYLLILSFIVSFFTGCVHLGLQTGSVSLEDIPEYSGKPYVAVNDNIPYFTDNDITAQPTAWHSVKYNNIDGKNLYNRCHLIGYQLTAENANEKNLITGTRYMNTEGMLPFENMVADYVKETKNHVLYRVTPIFDGDNLLADGVLMEAYSVEDKGESICYNVFCYNVQPSIIIDYTDGSSHFEDPKNEYKK